MSDPVPGHNARAAFAAREGSKQIGKCNKQLDGKVGAQRETRSGENGIRERLICLREVSLNR